MNEWLKNHRLILIVVGVLLAWGICGTVAGVHWHSRYTALRNTVESASAGELQQQLKPATNALGQATAFITESGESVAGLEEVDQRRAEWIGRIYGIADDVARSAIGIESGEQRARIAFEAIARIVDELEAEFGGSPK